MNRSEKLISSIDEVNYEKLKKLNAEDDHWRQVRDMTSDPKKKEEAKKHLAKIRQESEAAMKEK